MTDEDLYYEIPGDDARASSAPPPAAPAPAPVESAPPPPSPPVRPPPPSASAPPTPRRRSHRLTIALVAIGILLAVAIVAVLSFSVSIGPSTGNATYPYTVTYDVIFPTAEQVRIGNVTIVAIPSPDRSSVTLSVDKVPYVIALGEQRNITAKHATVSLLGLSIFSFDFTLEAEYLGMKGEDANFALSVRTSEQIPKFLIDRLLPPQVQARPV